MSTPVLAPTPPPRTRGAFVRLLPNLVWEAVLLLVVILVAISAAAAEERFFAPILWYQVAALGLQASAFALSLRTATPNLAVPTLSVAAGVWFVDLVNGGMAPAVAILLAILFCAGIGLVLGLITGLTSIPGWAVSFAAIAVVLGGLLTGYGARFIPLRNRDALFGADDYWPWLILAGVLSIGGGVVFAVPAIRRFLGASRPDGVDPAGFRPAKLPGALVGMVGSAALAGLAGAIIVRSSGGAASTTVDGMQMPTLVAIALLGGVSVFGVRAGIAGTFLAALLFALVRHWMLINRADAGTILIVVGVAVVLGVLVNWLLELVGRRIERGPTSTPPSPPPGGAPLGPSEASTVPAWTSPGTPTSPAWPSSSTPTSPAWPSPGPPTSPAWPSPGPPTSHAWPPGAPASPTPPAQAWPPGAPASPTPPSPTPPAQPWPPPPGQ
jgi:ribose/xylose/arabinose/galactoside ABC-type transport system permease subunit